MKRIIAILLFGLAATLSAQESATQKGKIFTVHNRDPREIAQTVRLLGSKGGDFSVNVETHTITVRDFPENLAAIEEAIARLDQPAPATPDIDLKISVLIGSQMPLASTSVPDDLASVVKQLKSTLRYSHYGLMTAAVHRTKSGRGEVQASGVADATLLGMTVKEGQPVIYSYTLRDVTSSSDAIDVGNFKFAMKMPIRIGAGPNQISYQDVGFETPVRVKPNEKVVIGTTTMGDKALIVVLTASSTAP